MAKLGAPLPGPWDLPVDYSNADARVAHFAKEEAALAAIGTRIVRWQRGDGYALYYVASFKPLTLRHIRVGDAWAVEEALIRGLRVSDVQAMLDRDARMRALFAATR